MFYCLQNSNMSDMSLMDSPINRPLTYAVWSEDIIVGRIGIKREATVLENFVKKFLYQHLIRKLDANFQQSVCLYRAFLKA